MQLTIGGQDTLALGSKDIEKCNALGNDGWELVCCIPETKDTYTQLVLKRPKQ